MNIDTLLEAAKYVDSGDVLQLQQSFTRGRDSTDGPSQGESLHPSLTSHKQLAGRHNNSSHTYKDISTVPNYTPLLVSTERHLPTVSSQTGHVSVSNTNVAISSSVIGHTPGYLPSNASSAYHVYAHIPLQNLQQQQPHHIPQQQQQQQQQQLQQQHHEQHHQPQLIQQLQKPPTKHQEQSIPATTKPSPSKIHPTFSRQPPPLLPTSAPSSSTSHLSAPQQAFDLLQLAEGTERKYTVLNPPTATSSHERNDLSGNASPRLVHQIVSHNQWASSEAPPSPHASTCSFKPSFESDSAESVTDGSGTGKSDRRAGIREVHNKLEKNRRAHLKECFENLRLCVPNMEDKKSKTSNLSILRGALKYVQSLNRKERELEHEIDRLVRQKIENQQRLDLLKIKNGMSTSEPVKVPRCMDAEDDEDDDRLVVVEEKDIVLVGDDKKPDDDDDQASTSTASEAEEEERKSQAQSRSGSPLHQPVSSIKSHPSFGQVGISLPYQQAYSSFRGPSRETLPYSNAPSHLMGLASSVSETPHSMTALRDVTQPRHPSVELASQLEADKRTTYLQKGQDKASTVLQNVANHISPTPKRETTSVMVPQLSGAMLGNSTRQTVSQLLGKQPVVRQPVRRQLSQLPVIQPPRNHILPRIMSTPQVRLGFTQASPTAIGPSKPVVTVGINSLLAQPSVIQTAGMHKTVISNGLVTTAADFTSAGPLAIPDPAALTTPAAMGTLALTTQGTTAVSAIDASSTKSIMTASVITQTLPGMSHAAHAPFISPIALQAPTAAAATPLLLTHPAPSYIGLPPAMITQPFISSFPTRPTHIQVATSTQVTPSSAVTKPLVHPTVQPINALSNSAISLALAQAAVPKHLQPMPTGLFRPPVSIAGLGPSNITSLGPSNITSLVPSNITKSPNGKTESTEVSMTSMPPRAQPSPKHQPPSPMSAKGKGSNIKQGNGINEKTELQITTSKIAETLANSGPSSQSMAKNGQSSATISSKTTQQSVLLKF